MSPGHQGPAISPGACCLLDKDRWGNVLNPDQHRRPAARSAHRRGLSFYWHMNDAQRAKLDTGKLKGHRREIIENDRIRTAPARGITINLLLFMCLFLLTFLDINISMQYNMHKKF